MDYVEPIQALVPGVQGRVLAVLAATDVELTMRTVASLAGVSVNRAVAVLNHLVDLGVVERREAGRAALVRLQADNEAARTLIALSRVHDRVVERLRHDAGTIRPAPAALVLFGSFATGSARAASDVDVLAVRRNGVASDDPSWTASLGSWSDAATRITGNPVNLVVVGEAEVPALRRRRRSLWRAIAEGGVLLAGSDLGRLGPAA
ncbi:MAG TPA: nucleotidyltransferase domain-containing protein [Acidimicrobiales bacterium]|nr:nucleotidyltransferase domain-containing protein [Acidimicrobiales bacterium]